MYIEVSDLFWGILGILGAIAIVYLIITLNNFSKLIKSINETLNSNRKNIDTLCNNLPDISENVTEISENLKDVSEVVTEATADMIVAKDSIVSNFETLKDVLNIIVSVFAKK